MHGGGAYVVWKLVVEIPCMPCDGVNACLRNDNHHKIRTEDSFHGITLVDVKLHVRQASARYKVVP